MANGFFSFSKFAHPLVKHSSIHRVIFSLSLAKKHLNRNDSSLIKHVLFLFNASLNEHSWLFVKLITDFTTYCMRWNGSRMQSLDYVSNVNLIASFCSIAVFSLYICYSSLIILLVGLLSTLVGNELLLFPSYKR